MERDSIFVALPDVASVTVQLRAALARRRERPLTSGPLLRRYRLYAALSLVPVSRRAANGGRGGPLGRLCRLVLRLLRKVLGVAGAARRPAGEFGHGGSAA